MINAKGLSRLPLAVQYVYYIVSACRVIGFRAWMREGRPNPFIRKG